jgi:hypothetical protein
MKYEYYLCIFLGIGCFAHTAFVVRLHIFIGMSDYKVIFVTSLVINIFLYLLDIIVNSSSFYICLLTVFAVNWAFIPALLQYRPFTCHISTIIKFLQIAWNSFMFAYFGSQTNVTPILFTVLALGISYLIMPIFILGYLFIKKKEFSFLSYFATFVNISLTSLFFSVWFSIDYSYIPLIICAVFRLPFIVDPYTFSCSFLSFINPYYAIILTERCRMRLMHSLLIIELFIYRVFAITYCTLTPYNHLVLIADILLCFLNMVYIKCLSHMPCIHKVIPYISYSSPESK